MEQLLTPYVIGHESGDFIEYACESCAVEFATQHALTWHTSHNFTERDASDYYAYSVPFHDGESDTPVACQCGQYLDVRLTSDGEEYVKERGDFPEWLVDALGVK